MKPAYTVVINNDKPAEIVEVDLTRTDGLSWREAKKQLRKFYTDKAREVRSMREKDFQ